MTVDCELTQGSLFTEVMSIVTELKEEGRALKSQINMMGKQVYTNKDVEKVLGVTAPTLRKWRYEGKIGYSQVDSKILFSRQDIDTFLNSHHYEAYAS